MSETDNSPSPEEVRLDMVDTLALELSDDSRVKKLIQQSVPDGSKINAIKELRALLAEDEFGDYRERISQIPEPTQEEDTAHISGKTNRMKHPLPPASNEFIVAKTVVNLLFPDKKR